jgi:hypothetical protein
VPPSRPDGGTRTYSRLKAVPQGVLLFPASPCVLCGDPGFGFVVLLVTIMKCHTLCAKQTQFAAGRSGAIMQNKANSGRGQEMVSAWCRKSYGGLATRAAPPKQSQFAGVVFRAKQSQFRSAGWLAPRAGGTNKANWRGGRLCKTNPISAGAAWDEAPGACNAGQSCETKPISPAGRHPVGESSKTNPIPGGAGRDEPWGTRGVTQTCKTNPICRRRAGPGARKRTPVRLLTANEGTK